VRAKLDQIIPPDESLALRGRTFLEWERQAQSFEREVTATLLEERAALEENARVERPGVCPGCGSTRVDLERRIRHAEVQTPHGRAVLARQSARCRACGRSFSPSGAGLGPAPGGAPEPRGGAASGAGGGGAEL
jgi:hypothetical protein